MKYPETSTAVDGSYFYVRCCPYTGDCDDYPVKCSSCKHNPRRSHYEPAYPWYPYPAVPYDPPYEPWRVTWN